MGKLTYRDYLLSDENIYHAIYSMESYVFDYNLLDIGDKIRYHRLKDKFSEKCIDATINKVRERIEKLLDEGEYISAKVYFRPKKIENDGKVVFRPLHTTDLITQIAIVSMLHLFIYDRTEDDRLILSNLSRLIPANFFGNRVSTDPAYLFKPWKNQYQAYNQKANDALKKYHTSLEYKYEVSLDLENFFPTIDPMVVYDYIIRHLPTYLNEDDRVLLKKVLHKLVFCRLETKLSQNMQEEYCKTSKHRSTDSSQKKDTLCGYVRGIPQGLPQSYFLGNIYMLIIYEILKKDFPGVAYFYVDDSVIFTNEISEEGEEFTEKLKHINTEIRNTEKFYRDRNSNLCYPENTEEFYKSSLYGVGLHLEGKSNYVRLDTLDESDLYLKCISREVSQGGNDFFRMYSDEENRNLEKKFERLARQVDARWNTLEQQKNSEETKKRKESLQRIQDKLNRYYKFFEYRRMRLAVMHEPESLEEEYKKQKEELRSIIFGKNGLKYLPKVGNVEKFSNSDRINILQEFMEQYRNNIWDAAVGMYRQIADEKEIEELREYILLIDRLCMGEKDENCSYMRQVYKEPFSEQKNTGLSERYKDRILDFQIDIVEINEQQNPDFNPIDLFLRLNSKPFPIEPNTFEMWNAYVKKEYVENIKEIAKEYSGILFKAKDTRMKNEELITMLAYLAYKKRKNGLAPKECLNIYVRNQRINARFTQKSQITNVLGEISRNEDLVFGEAIEDIKNFIHKLSILTGDNFEEWNKLLAHSKKNTQSKTNQNFYLLWIALSDLTEEKIKNNKKQIFHKINKYFKECQDIKEEEFDVEQFVKKLSMIC